MTSAYLGRSLCQQMTGILWIRRKGAREVYRAHRVVVDDNRVAAQQHREALALGAVFTKVQQISILTPLIS